MKHKTINYKIMVILFILIKSEKKNEIVFSLKANSIY